MKGPRLLLLSALGLSGLTGCWPHIPGAAADYGEVGLYGGLRYTEYLGDYWGDAEDGGFAFLGTLDPAQRASWWQLYSNSLGGCETDKSFWADVMDDFEDPDADREISMQLGTHGVDLVFGEQNLYQGSIREADWDYVTEVALSGDARDDLGIGVLGETPGNSEVLTPDLDTSELPVLGKDDFTISFGSNDADYATLLISMVPMHDQGNLLSTVGCTFPADEPFTVPESLLDDFEEPNGARIEIGLVKEGSGRLDDGTANGFAVELSRLGFATAE